MGCREVENSPLFPSGEMPNQVENPEVTNIPGGAIISYRLPSNNKNLLSVTARITMDNGKKKEFSSSLYSNSVKVEGLVSSEERIVQLISIGKGLLESQPVEVKIKPLESPLMKAFNSMTVEGAFGGVSVQLENEDKATIGINLLANDSLLSEFGLVDSYFSEKDLIEHTFRSYPSVEAPFGFYLVDEWGNFSDTLLADLTPFFEYQLDKDLFKFLKLPGDALIEDSRDFYIAQVKPENMWDGKWSSDFNDPIYGGGMYYDRFITRDPNGQSTSRITIDLGKISHLSRFRLNPCEPYADRTMRLYEIWGATEPDPDGSWNGWTKMLEFEQVKPSGLPAGQYTQEDIDNWLEGDHASFDPDLPPVRYIRINCVENWRNSTNLQLAEITFWGDDE